MTFAHAARASTDDVGTGICCGPLPDATDSAFGTGPLGCIDTGALFAVSGTADGTGDPDSCATGEADACATGDADACDTAPGDSGAACERGAPLLDGVCGTVVFGDGRAPP